MDFILTLPLWFKMLLSINAACCLGRIVVTIVYSFVHFPYKNSKDIVIMSGCISVSFFTILLHVGFSILTAFTSYAFFKLLGAL
jgi:hypothetical protein